jgi:tubby-related protein 1
VTARRGPASAEKENLGPRNIGNGKEEKVKAATATAAAAELSKPVRLAPAVAPPPPLQLRMKDDSAEAAAAAPPVFVGPRGRELLPPPSSSYEAWDLSDSESAPASSWATLPNRYAMAPARPFSPPP